METPTKRRNVPDAHPRYALRSRVRCRGDAGLSARAPAYQPLSRVRNTSQLTPNQWHIPFVEVMYCKDTRPRRQLEAANQQHSYLIISAELTTMLASIPSLWEWVALFAAFKARSLLRTLVLIHK